ncbi:MAG: hypothetical protein GWP05_05680, partial [Anaerolineaceae bacterium]|nr:hypothetical protein [Anaerolineaceae bacterium]
DLKVVLDETAAAEEFFKRHRFANFNVERLPNSGHDSRPEVAFNFVRGLQNKLLARRRKRWQGLCKSAQSAVAEGQVSKARLWFERAVTLERRFGFPGTAGRGLKELPEVSSQKKEPADN